MLSRRAETGNKGADGSEVSTIRDLTGLKRLLFQRILILVQSNDSLLSLTTCVVLYCADVRLLVCSSHGGNECKRVVRKSVPLNL